MIVKVRSLYFILVVKLLVQQVKNNYPVRNTLETYALSFLPFCQRQSPQRGATPLDGFPGLKEVAWEPPHSAGSSALYPLPFSKYPSRLIHE
nr:hypothetical protein [Dendronalium sp. ChiSLP03b]